jgi:hypothetical protein
MPKHVPRGMKKYIDVERNKCRLLLLLTVAAAVIKCCSEECEICCG